MYDKAKQLISRTSSIVAIGYRFGELDIASYKPLLRVAPPDAILLVVAPDAKETAERLRGLCPIDVVPLAATFRQWVDSGYSGLG